VFDHLSSSSATTRESWLRSKGSSSADSIRESGQIHNFIAERVNRFALPPTITYDQFTSIIVVSRRGRCFGRFYFALSESFVCVFHVSTRLGSSFVSVAEHRRRSRIPPSLHPSTNDRRNVRPIITRASRPSRLRTDHRRDDDDMSDTPMRGAASTSPAAAPTSDPTPAAGRGLRQRKAKGPYAHDRGACEHHSSSVVDPRAGVAVGSAYQGRARVASHAETRIRSAQRRELVCAP
jgi:hypothetical protein